METLHQKEKSQARICKKWLVIEKCSGCIFEALCGYEERCKQQKHQEK